VFDELDSMVMSAWCARPFRFVTGFLIVLLWGATLLCGIPNTGAKGAHIGTYCDDDDDMSLGLFQISVLLPSRSLRSIAPESLSQSRIWDMDFARGTTSTSVLCVIVLAAESLAFHTLLSVSRNVDELGGSTASITTETLKVAWRFNAYPAMLSMLFLACRMSLISHAGNLGHPPLAVRVGMIVVTSAVSLQYLWVALLPLCLELPGMARLSELVGEPYQVHPSIMSLTFKATCLKICALSMQILLACSIYGGVCSVITGMALSTSRMSLEFFCVICLVPLHMSVQLLLWLLRMWSDVRAKPVSGHTEYVRSALAGVSAASSVVERAPVSAALFVAFRLRTWQLESDGPATLWGQRSAAAVVGSLYLETAVAAYVAATGESMEVDLEEHESIHAAGLGAHIAGGAAAAVGYLGVVGIMICMFLVRGQDGMNPALSPAVRSVFILSVLFFAVRGLHCLAHMILVLRTAFRYDFGDNLKALYMCLKSAAVGVSICPALCAVFLGARMRALFLTDRTGSPQAWAQDCMVLCVFATYVQVLSSIGLKMFTGTASRIDSEGFATYDVLPISSAYGVAFIKFLTLLTTHIAATLIIIATFLMTPENTMEGEGSTNILKRLVQALGWVLVVVLFALILSSAKAIGLAAKIAIETYGDKVLGIRATADNAVFCPWNGHVYVGNLWVLNDFALVDDDKFVDRCKASDWRTPYLLRIEKLKVLFDLCRIIWTLCGRIEIEISEVVIKGLDVQLEKAGQTTNVQMLLKSVLRAYEQFCGVVWPGEDPYAPGEIPMSEFYSLLLHKIFVKDVHVDVLLPTRSLSFEIEDFDCPDMYNRPMGMGDLMMFILNTILKNILANASIKNLSIARDIHRTISMSASRSCGEAFAGLGSVCSKKLLCGRGEA